jgi:lactose/L-arabinose transport system ATP-binding protein
MRLEIARLHQELGSTMIYVTHDQVEAMTLANRIVVLNMGRIEQVGAPLELYENPDNRFVAGFIGSPRMNFVEAEVLRAAGDRVVVAAPAVGLDKAELQVRGSLPAAGTRVSLGVRPEHFAAEDTSPSIQGKIDLVERLGSVTYVHASLADGTTIAVESRNGGAFRKGEIHRFGIETRHAFLFDEGGARL